MGGGGPLLHDVLVATSAGFRADPGCVHEPESGKVTGTLLGGSPIPPSNDSCRQVAARRGGRRRREERALRGHEGCGNEAVASVTSDIAVLGARSGLEVQFPGTLCLGCEDHPPIREPMPDHQEQRHNAHRHRETTEPYGGRSCVTHQAMRHVTGGS